MANTSLSLTSLDDGTLLLVASFLTRTDLPIFFSICRVTAALTNYSTLWENAWPWNSERGIGAPPIHAVSWRDAHKQVCAIRRGVPMPVEDVTERARGVFTAYVTCAAFTPVHRIYGMSDGTLLVISEISITDDTQKRAISKGESRSPSPTTSTQELRRVFTIGAGSVRHMQLAGVDESLCFVGSWDGRVHCADLSFSRPQVWEVCAPAREPIFGLRVNRSLLFTCSGDGAICMWQLYVTQPNTTERNTENLMRAIATSHESSSVSHDANNVHGASTSTTHTGVASPDSITGKNATVIDISNSLSSFVPPNDSLREEETHRRTDASAEKFIKARRIGVLLGHTGGVTDFCIQRLKLIAELPKRSHSKDEQAVFYSHGINSTNSSVGTPAKTDGTLAVQINKVSALASDLASPVAVTPNWRSYASHRTNDALHCEMLERNQPMYCTVPSSDDSPIDAVDISPKLQPDDRMKFSSDVRDRENIGVMAATPVTDAYDEFPRVIGDAHDTLSLTSLALHWDHALRPMPSARASRIASTSYDGTVRLWDTTSQACVAVLTGHKGPSWTVASKGKWIFSGGADGTVRVWRTACSALSKHMATNVSSASVAPKMCSLPSQLNTDSSKDSSSGNTSNHLLEWKDVAVLNPYSACNVHRQIWCLKVVGDCVLAGASDGCIYCYDVNPSNLRDLQSLNCCSTNAATANPLLWAFNTTGGPLPTNATGNATDYETVGGRHRGHSGYSESPSAIATGGIRRIDIVRDRLYACTDSGCVLVYRFRGLETNEQRRSDLLTREVN